MTPILASVEVQGPAGCGMLRVDGAGEWLFNGGSLGTDRYVASVALSGLLGVTTDQAARIITVIAASTDGFAGSPSSRRPFPVPAPVPAPPPVPPPAPQPVGVEVDLVGTAGTVQVHCNFNKVFYVGPTKGAGGSMPMQQLAGSYDWILVALWRLANGLVNTGAPGDLAGLRAQFKPLFG